MNTFACILYTLFAPIVYNAGTSYERTCDTFLYSYAPSDDSAKAMAAELNKTATDRRYFASRQEAMGD